MISLSVRIDEIHFDETCRYLHEMYRTGEIHDQFIRELIRLYVNGEIEWYAFRSATTSEPIDLDTANLVMVVLATSLTSVIFFPEDDYWLISMMFDQFPYHTLDVHTKSVLVFPTELSARLHTLGETIVLIAKISAP